MTANFSCGSSDNRLCNMELSLTSNEQITKGAFQGRTDIRAARFDMLECWCIRSEVQVYHTHSNPEGNHVDLTAVSEVVVTTPNPTGFYIGQHSSVCRFPVCIL